MPTKILFMDINPSPLITQGIMPAFQSLGFEIELPRNKYQFDELKYPDCMHSTLTEREKYNILYKAVKCSDADTIFMNGANYYYNAIVDAAKETNKKLIYWATEDPVLYDLMFNIIAKHADLVLSPAIECVEKYRKVGLNAQLMMFGCNPEYHTIGKFSSSYDYDIVLQASCYNHPARIKGYETVVKAAIKLYEEGYKIGIWGAFWDTPFGMQYLNNHKELYKGWHPNEDIPDICASAKIILGIQCSDQSQTQQSMRSFEILSSKGFHLTQWVKSMDYWFENGEHLVTVKNYEEAYKKMKYYLQYEQERKQIAEQGHLFVRNSHTYEDRIKESILPYINW
jgi:spore maturation protein CgeB